MPWVGLWYMIMVFQGSAHSLFCPQIIMFVEKRMTIYNAKNPFAEK